MTAVDDSPPPSVLIDLDLIDVPDDRQRQKAEADNMLTGSIQSRGLLQPIIVHEKGANGRHLLVAGERRIDAHRKLQRPQILARIFEQLSPIAAFEIELQENIARQNLSWQELVGAVGRYHAMRCEQFTGWTQMGTGNALGYSQAYIAKMLIIAEELADTEVTTCPTMQGAFNLISARADRARIAAQSRGLVVAGATKLVIPPAMPVNATREERTAALLQNVDLTGKAAATIADMDQQIADIHSGRLAAAALEQQRRTEIVSDLIITADFLEWAAGYAGPKFDVLHIDFPYGKNYSGARTRKTSVPIAPVYADDPDIFFGLVAGFLAVQDRIAFGAAHALIWYDMQYHQWLIEQFLAADWSLVQPHPFIWSKGYQGIAADVKRRPRHVYETCLMFVRGDRKIVKIEKDVIDCPIDEKLHLNQKPMQMLLHLLSIFVDEHTAVLDPTCGSGSALAAVAKLRCARFLGIELDENNAQVARFLLQRHAPDVAAHSTSS